MPERSLIGGVINSEGMFIVVKTYVRSEPDILFLSELGFSRRELESNEALSLERVLRPINFALTSSFKGLSVLSSEELRALQIAIANSPYYSSLPRYGPAATWKEMEASGLDPHRRLTKEERVFVTDTAFKTLPKKTFLALESNGVKKHKKELDAALGDTAGGGDLNS